MRKKAAKPAVELIPDSAILIQTRIRAGEHGTRLGEIANLILQDPVLSLEFLQSANSVMYAGAAVSSVETAITRLGMEELVSTLAGLNEDKKFENDGIAEMFEVLRYSCRRTSIVALIIATVLRPSMAESVRTSALFSDMGHMIALLRLGEGYLTTAKGANRKNLPYRLERDHKMDVSKLLVDFLEHKGIPERLMVPYDQTREVRSSFDVDLRCCVRSAIELIEAFDGKKLDNYNPEHPLPVRSDLRLLNTTIVQHERIFEACSQYLEQIQKEEAPQGASFLITSDDDADESMESEAVLGEGTNSITVPNFTSTDVSAKSKTQLQGLFELCHGIKDSEKMRSTVVDYLQESALFNRAAVVCVSANGEEAFISHVIGEGLEEGTPVDISNDLSPFKHFRVDIKSTPTKRAAPTAPFGVSAYAIGPLDTAENGDRFLLYADNSEATALVMESRRVFRMILGLVRKSLKELTQ